MTLEEMRKQQTREEALHASSLRVPRRYVFSFIAWVIGFTLVGLSVVLFFFLYFRPPWRAYMSVEELDDNERQAFLIWRRRLARLGLDYILLINLVTSS